MIIKEEILQFLLKARTKTYAGGKGKDECGEKVLLKN